MFYNLVIRPVMFRLPPEFAHELSIQVIIWWARWRTVQGYLRDLDYWMVVIVAFCLGMLTPVRWRVSAIKFWIDVAIALRAGLPRI